MLRCQFSSILFWNFRSGLQIKHCFSAPHSTDSLTVLMVSEFVRYDVIFVVSSGSPVFSDHCDLSIGQWQLLGSLFQMLKKWIFPQHWFEFSSLQMSDQQFFKLALFPQDCYGFVYSQLRTSSWRILPDLSRQRDSLWKTKLWNGIWRWKSVIPDCTLIDKLSLTFCILVRW